MNKIKFYVLGILFGIILTKSEVISWLRIYEMFEFRSFHMYGVIGAAVGCGLLIVQFIKHFKLKDSTGNEIQITPKEKTFIRYLLGGTTFGFGWAMTGACPGPMFALVGNGVIVMLAVIASATLGTFVYGVLKDKLPH